jgi:transcriptional regulator of acetoin/glycerol metabolism
MSAERIPDFSGCRYDYARIFSRLGKVPDAALADEIGATRWLVRRVRMRHRIPRFDPLTAFEGALGTVPDHEIARLAGVSRSTVWRRRRRLGVMAYGLQ